jgi:cation diffusion facilitator family transporter
MRNGKYVSNNDYKEVFVSALIANLGLAILKLSVGLIGYSKLVLMDGLFSFTNAMVLVLMWHGDRLEKKPPDEKHPYGYGKVLFLIASMAGLIILVISIYMFIYSINSMLWDEIHRSHSGAMMVAIISIVTNEALYRYLKDESRRHTNTILAWNANNNRMNVFVSSLVFICVLSASLGVSYAERIGVGVISLVLFALSMRVLFKGFSGIMDRIPEKDQMDKINLVASKSPGVQELLDIKARHIGSNIHLDLSISVKETLNMQEAHKIVTDLETKLIKEIPLIQEVNVILG